MSAVDCKNCSNRGKDPQQVGPDTFVDVCQASQVNKATSEAPITCPDARFLKALCGPDGKWFKATK